MLTHLTLINFALADHLAIDIEQGFNVLTGETGAGKSLLLDALSRLLRGTYRYKLCPLWFRTKRM
ncbi:ATP-binding protein [Acinetobacter baumannii]